MFLCSYFPRRYNDCSKVTELLSNDEISCIIVRVQRIYYYKNDAFCASCNVIPTNEVVHVTWFNQGYLSEKIERLRGKQVYVCGKATYDANYNNYQIVSPIVFDLNIEEAQRIYPVYSKIKNIADDYLTKRIERALTLLEAFNAPYPDCYAARYHLCSTEEAITEAHVPKSKETLKRAEDRSIFDDLVYFALINEWANRNCPQGSAFFINNLNLYRTLLQGLPFTLTEGQGKTLKKMLNDVKARETNQSFSVG